jgi:hypothetical protein
MKQIEIRLRKKKMKKNKNKKRAEGNQTGPGFISAEAQQRVFPKGYQLPCSPDIDR